MEKKTVKTPFGEIAQTEDGQFHITDEQWYKILENTYKLPNAKETLMAVNDAKLAFAKDGYTFLADEVVRTKTTEEVSLNVGTGNNNILLRLNPKGTVTKPSSQKGVPPTHETCYGICRYTEQHVLPASWKKDDGFLREIADRIEKAIG